MHSEFETFDYAMCIKISKLAFFYLVTISLQRAKRGAPLYLLQIPHHLWVLKLIWSASMLPL